MTFSLVGLGCRIRQLYLCKEVKKPSKRVSRDDPKPSDGKVPVLKFWGMWSTPSLSLLSGALWPGVVAPDRVLSIAKIELFDI